jgi:hypothetical protein
MLKMSDTHLTRAALTANLNQIVMTAKIHQSSRHSARLPLLLGNDNDEKFHTESRDLRREKKDRQNLEMH